MASDVYRIELRPAAFRSLEKLDKVVRVRVARKIGSLANNPRPAGVKKLKDEEGLWRVRVGDYRVIYSIQDEILLIVVVRVGHRSEVYRK